jgi:hypothetical protein
MRILGTNGTSAPAAGTAAKRSSSGTFSLEGENTTKSAAPAAGMRSIGGLDALLALQEDVDGPTEKRRRAVKRGRSALDALDALKLGLLSGTLDTGALARLKTAASGLSEATGDPGLDTVMAEIDLRVEVELAKIGMPKGDAKT